MLSNLLFLVAFRFSVLTGYVHLSRVIIYMNLFAPEVILIAVAIPFVKRLA